jgi:hypothetical protein
MTPDEVYWTKQLVEVEQEREQILASFPDSVGIPDNKRRRLETLVWLREFAEESLAVEIANQQEPS